MAVRLGFSPAAKLQMRSIMVEEIMIVRLGFSPAAKKQMRSIAREIMAVWLGLGPAAEKADAVDCNSNYGRTAGPWSSRRKIEFNQLRREQVILASLPAS